MLALFNAASLYVRVGVIVTALAAVGGWFTYWTFHEYNKGWNDHAAFQDKVDNAKASGAADSRSTAHACADAGGVWRQSSGKCER